MRPMVHARTMLSLAREDRVAGGLLGLLIGDALGVPYEFHPPARLVGVKIEMTPPPGFRRAHAGVPPGTWSDDGAQALCLLESLLERDRFEIDDFAARLLAWRQRGHLAVDGKVFDIGIQTHRALDALARGSAPHQSGPSGERDNGNGALMRVLPLALWHRGEDDELVRDAMASSLPTHGHLRSQLACALYCLWARYEVAADGGDTWSAAVGKLDTVLGDYDDETRAELELLDPEELPEAGGSGYVVDCLHSARTALLADEFEHVVHGAIALGNDTDTTAAVAGGIAGVRCGAAAIPERWRSALRGRELLQPLLDRLLARA